MKGAKRKVLKRTKQANFASLVEYARELGDALGASYTGNYEIDCQRRNRCSEAVYWLSGGQDAYWTLEMTDRLESSARDVAATALPGQPADWMFLKVIDAMQWSREDINAVFAVSYTLGRLSKAKP